MVLLILSSFHDKEDKMMVLIKMSTHLKTKEMLHQKKATTSILIWCKKIYNRQYKKED